MALGVTSPMVHAASDNPLGSPLTPPRVLPSAPTGAGTIVPIGGALRFDHDQVWQRLNELAGGSRARWVVFGLASSQPQRAAQEVVRVLQQHGAALAEAIEITAPADTSDAGRIAQVKRATGVFFCGGAQERIVDALMPAGIDTPLLATVRTVAAKGGVISGTSAGAAIMSTHMFRDAQDALTVLKGQLREGKEIDRGLGFVGPGLFVDQHFLRRGRIGRMLPMMVARGYKLGLGVDENSAAVIRGNAIEIIGAKGALLVDLSGAASQCRDGAFCLRGARLSYLDRGDRFDLDSRRMTPSAPKRSDHVIDPTAADFKPYYPHARFWPDMLGDTVISNAMSELIDSGDQDAFGLAGNLVPHPGDFRPELGYEFRLYKGPDSMGWFTGSFGGEDYSVSNLYLDVVPVRMAQPAYRPWTA